MNNDKLIWAVMFWVMDCTNSQWRKQCLDDSDAQRMVWHEHLQRTVTGH